MPSAGVPEHYRVYGLALRSSIAIEGLEAVTSNTTDPDVDLVTGDVAPLGGELLATDPADDEEPAVQVERVGDTFVFAYRDGTRFRLEDRGRRITTEWTSTAADMATYLLGPILAFVLRLRGVLALHASAVSMRGRALLLCGAAGAGKSTTATALLLRGARAVTDDVAAIVWQDARPYVQPGYPRLRLWSDSVARLYGAPDALPLLTPTWEKRFASTESSFVREPQEVGAIAVLRGREADAAHVRRLQGHEAVMSILVRTSVQHLLDGADRRDELARIAQLVAAVPVFELRARDDLEALDEVTTALETLL